MKPVIFIIAFVLVYYFLFYKQGHKCMACGSKKKTQKECPEKVLGTGVASPESLIPKGCEGITKIEKDPTKL